MTVTAPPLLGVREPRIRVVPPYEQTYGHAVAELARHAGLVLDAWQADCLDDFCAVRPGGRWNTFENAAIVSRQNGKGGIFEARVLASLFLFDERLVLYSAHRFATAREMFLRIRDLITETDDFRRRVKKVSSSHGEEGIEMLSGQRLRFLARTGNSGRGFSGDTNILDEAFNLDGDAISALMPTMSAMPNPQVYYGSSAGWEISVQLGRVRRRALKAIKDGVPDPSLAYREWSAPDDTPQTREAMADRALWAMANPALGIRLSEEFTAGELRSMDPADFARERLGIGSYPVDEDEGWEVIGEDAWNALADPASTMLDPVAFAVDTTPERSHTAIGAASRRADGRLHVEVVEHRRGTGWVVPRLLELSGRWSPCAVAVDPGGPAGSLIPDLEAAGIEVLKAGSRDVAQACGGFIDAVRPAEGEPPLRHLDDPALNAAIKGARRRDLGDGASAWSRRAAVVDISPLVAVTLAAWGHACAAPGWGGDYDALANIY